MNIRLAPAALAGLLLLGSCNRAPTEGQMEDIASDAAVDAVAGRFSDLESRIDTLESETAELETQALSLKDDVASAEADTAEVESALAALRSEYEGHTH